MRILLTVLWIAIVGGPSIWGGLALASTNGDTVYGILTFSTEDQYTAFKEALIQPGIEIKDVSSLSSSPPIIVKYSAHIDKGVDFPYEGTRSSDANETPVVVLGIFSLALGLLVIWQNKVL